MKISRHIPQVSHAVSAPAVAKTPAAPAVVPSSSLDALYQEITAPRIDMSQLIVDPRPERAHPLLQAEVQALRVQANCFRNGSEPVANSHRRGRTEPDTIPERLDEVPPGVRERLAKKRRGQKKASVQNQASSKNPRWAKSTRKRIPSTAALHAMVRAGYVVGQGYRGKEASELQTLLNRRGLQTEVTGIFDSQTERSLRSLQRQNGLDATGVLDAQSLAALEGRLV